MFAMHAMPVGGKAFKRMLAALLSVSMILSSMPIEALAEATEAVPSEAEVAELIDEAAAVETEQLEAEGEGSQSETLVPTVSEQVTIDVGETHSFVDMVVSEGSLALSADESVAVVEDVSSTQEGETTYLSYSVRGVGEGETVILVEDGNTSETIVEHPVLVHHDYVAVVTLEPTCAAEGTMTYTCRGCGHSYEEPIAIDAEAHVWDESYTVDKEATYGQDGIESIHCTLCGVVQEGSERVIPALEQRSIESASILGLSTMVYEGQAVIPTFEVVLDGLSLVEGTDFAATLQNNEAPGMATLVISGVGKYTGEKTETFRIVPAIPTDVTVSVQSSTAAIVKWKAPFGADYVEVWRCVDGQENVLVGVYGATAGQAVAKGLTPATAQSFQVRAYAKAGSENYYSDYSSVVTIELPPSAPTGLKATNPTMRRVDLYWTPYDDADLVEVWRSTDPKCEYKNSVCIGIYNAYAGTCTSKNLNPSTTYYYKVREYRKLASGKKVYSGYSSIVSAKTASPTAPEYLNAASNGLTSIHVSWSPVAYNDYPDNLSGKALVEVWRSTDPKCEYKNSVCIGIYGSDTIDAVSRNLAPGTTYYYKVRSYVYVNGHRYYSGYSSIAKAKTESVTAPTQLRTIPRGLTEIELFWQCGGYADVDEFTEVWRSTDPSCEYSKSVCIGIYNASAGNAYSRRLAPGTTYYYKLRNYVKSNGKKYYSGYSQIVSASTEALRAPSVYAYSQSETSAHIYWMTPCDASSVEVWYSTTPGCPNGSCYSLGVFSGSEGETTQYNLTPGATYYYKAVAIVGSGATQHRSGYSSVASVSMPAPAPAPSSGGGSSTTSDYVLITATGTKYHRLSGCRSTNRANVSTTTVSLEYAQSHGYTACSNCYH